MLLGNLTGVFGERTLLYTQNESARTTSYYVSTLYAVSKSFAKCPLDTAAERALSCSFFFSRRSAVLGDVHGATAAADVCDLQTSSEEV